MEHSKQHPALRLTWKPDLLPVKHQLDKLISEAVLRIATSPSYNDIIRPRFQQWKFKRKPKKNRKIIPLERHTERFEKRYGKTESIEKLRPFSAPPDYTCEDRKDRPQGLPLQPVGAGHRGRIMRMRSSKADSSLRTS